MRVMQGIKDQNSKGGSPIKSFKDSTGNSSSTRQEREFSGAIESAALKGGKIDKLKQAEESLRTVMYLSCWGPN